jgi:ketosteroid isomerase-like protein
MRLIATILIAIALSTPMARAASDAHSTDSVRAAEQARAAALLKADTTAISQLMADDFVEISRLGTLRTKADNLRDIAGGNLKLLTVQYDSTNVRMYGDVAVLRAIANNTGMFHGAPFAGRVWYTRVFVWRDGRWQAVTMQQTPIP